MHQYNEGENITNTREVYEESTTAKKPTATNHDTLRQMLGVQRQFASEVI